METVLNHLPLWGDALQGTLILFFGGGIIAVILGLIVGAMRVSPIPIARSVASFYVGTIRNTPLTLVFFGMVFALPILAGQRMEAMLLGIAALGIYTATYVAEVVRSGINTVPVGQAEAARALGLGFGQVMGLVVLPQAFRSVIPPLMSVIIALLKNTTVASGFAILNLGNIRNELSERGENALQVVLWVMVVFVVLVLVLSWIQNILERKMRIAR